MAAQGSRVTASITVAVHTQQSSAIVLCPRVGRNGLKSHQEKCRLDIRNNFFSERVVGHWHSLPRESPSLEVFQNSGEVALRDVVSGQCWW